MTGLVGVKSGCLTGLVGVKSWCLRGSWLGRIVGALVVGRKEWVFEVGLVGAKSRCYFFFGGGDQGALKVFRKTVVFGTAFAINNVKRENQFSC